MANLTQLAEQLVNLTVKEVKELTDILKDQYGIEPAAAGAGVAAAAAATDEGMAAASLLPQVPPPPPPLAASALPALSPDSAAPLPLVRPSTAKRSRHAFSLSAMLGEFA